MIGKYVFNSCSSLKQVIIPSSVTSIPNYAFNQCSSLSQITIPSSITSIGDNAFNECKKLSQITVPSSVTSIGDYAFNQCTALYQITIPSSVTSIGDNAFNDCIRLVSIKIPISVNFLGKNVFSGCLSLVEITIPSYLITSNEYDLINKKTYYSVFYNDLMTFVSKKNSSHNHFICIDFNEHQVTPSDYSIKFSNHIKRWSPPKSWFIEGSTNNREWQLLVMCKNYNSFDNEKSIHKFAIDYQIKNRFRYIRINQISDIDYFKISGKYYDD